MEAHAQHRKAARHGHADGQAPAHGGVAHGAVGHVLNLLVEHVHGGLGGHDEVAHERGHAHEHPPGALASQDFAQVVAGGHEADVGAQEEQHQAHIGDRDAAQHAAQLGLVHAQRHGLRHKEDRHDGQKAQRDFLEVERQVDHEELESLLGGLNLGDGKGGVRQVGGVKEQAQHHDRQDRAHAADGHHAECVLVLAGEGRQARAHRDDERHGDGAGGDAARVERHGEELCRHEARQQEHQAVESHDEVAQRNAELHAQEGHHEERAHADGHGDDERHVGHGGHLAGEHLQVGLGHGHRDADGQAHAHDEERLVRLGELLSDGLADGHHGDVSAEGKEARACYEKRRTQDEEEQRADGHGCDCE